MSRLDRFSEEQWCELALAAQGSVTVLANLCGVSPRQLERYLRVNRGVLPVRWLNEMRLNYAPVLLCQGLTVKEAANSLGYEDASHFAKTFKVFHGVSPSRFTAKGKRAGYGKGMLGDS